jgi:hypothetical protein
MTVIEQLPEHHCDYCGGAFNGRAYHDVEDYDTVCAHCCVELLLAQRDTALVDRVRLVGEVERLRLQVAALENDGMELAAKLGESEEQIARLRERDTTLVERLRSVLCAVLIEPDPIKRNQLAAPVLTAIRSSSGS